MQPSCYSRFVGEVNILDQYSFRVRFGDLHVQTAVFLPIDTTGRARSKLKR